MTDPAPEILFPFETNRTTGQSGHTAHHNKLGFKVNQMRADLDQGLIASFQRAEKPGSTARTSTVTIADDPDLHLPIAANSKYAFELLLHYDADLTGKLNLRLNGPAGATLFGVAHGVASANTAVTLAAAALGSWVHRNISSSPGQIGGCGTGVFCTYRLAGTVTTAATAGELAVGWAQGTSSTVATTLFSRSELTLTKVA